MQETNLFSLKMHFYNFILVIGHLYLNWYGFCDLSLSLLFYCVFTCSQYDLTANYFFCLAPQQMRGKEKREAYGGGGGGYSSRRDYQDDSYR